MRTVTALYVDLPRGPYAHLEGVDPWGTARDARTYAGPNPVVAHPPCGPWGRLRHLYRGDEHDCAPRAVEQVRKFGGVLEHPAGSKLWEACGLPLPYGYHLRACQRRRGVVCGCTTGRGDEYTIVLDQCEWGHVARKRTWLYCVRVPRSALETPPYPGREPTKSVCGRRGRPTQAKHPNWREQLPRCSDPERRRTPPEFAAYLVRLARAVQR